MDRYEVLQDEAQRPVCEADRCSAPGARRPERDVQRNAVMNEFAERSGIEILVVDDDVDVCGVVTQLLSERGFVVHCEQGAEAAIEYLKGRNVCLLIVDLRMPGMDGLEFIRTLKKTMRFPPEIIVMSGYGSVETAVEAVKSGAFDFVEKPFSLEKMLVTVDNALKKCDLENRICTLEEQIKREAEFSAIVGRNPELLRMVELAKQIASTGENVLICGESGTGKDLFARAIHNTGPRRNGPFVAINCGAIAENLLESELFGHEKGSFSGAVARRVGHFEQANGGTIFLDEVTELPLNLQVKILRVVQEKEVLRVGNSVPIQVDCAIIAATNRDVEVETKEGRFRMDLYYRLNVVDLKIPPLRDRRNDIPLLVSSFLDKYTGGKMTVDGEVLKVFQKYSWPGNIRELENVIKRACVLAQTPVITADLLPEKLMDEKHENPVMEFSNMKDYREVKERARNELTRDYVQQVLRNNNGNVTRSANQMGITRQSLHKIMKKCGLSSVDFKAVRSRE